MKGQTKYHNGSAERTGAVLVGELPLQRQPPTKQREGSSRNRPLSVACRHIKEDPNPLVVPGEETNKKKLLQTAIGIALSLVNHSDSSSDHSSVDAPADDPLPTQPQHRKKKRKDKKRRHNK